MGGRKTDPIEKLVGQYSAWLGGRPDQEALGNLDLMLTVHRDYLDAECLRTARGAARSAPISSRCSRGSTGWGC